MLDSVLKSHKESGEESVKPMYSGVNFRVCDPQKSQYEISDIARNLSNMACFSGGTEFFYSFAQRACILSYMVEDDLGVGLARVAILKDLYATYMGAVSKQILEYCPELIDLKERLTRPGFEVFGLDPDLWNTDILLPIVDELRAVEYRDLRPNCVCPVDVPPSEEIFIHYQGPKSAYIAFTRRFLQLFPDHVSEPEYVFGSDVNWGSGR